MAVESAALLTHPVTTDLLNWYAASARALPWRTPPGGAAGDNGARPDPYRVWLSEVMLQQTTVAAVTPYFTTFTARWPTVSDLAAAPDADVLAAWAGLGYYSRARNLIACARRVVADHGGQFPDDLAGLRALPGIGDYTAAAISSIAFGSDAIPVDANIERVVARLFAIATPLKQARAAICAAARTIWPPSAQGNWPAAANGGDFAQALMDLGARICTSRAPACDRCPLARHCTARAQGIATALPVKPAKKVRPERHGRALWIERDGMVRLVRRPPTGLLGGMRALPGDAWTDTAQAPAPGTTPLGQVRHIFTHFALTLSLDYAPERAAPDGAGEWWPIATLDAAGLPTLYRRAALLATHTAAARPER
jgi:A/G-specific adenine glycosylase